MHLFFYIILIALFLLILIRAISVRERRRMYLRRSTQARHTSHITDAAATTIYTISISGSSSVQ